MRVVLAIAPIKKGIYQEIGVPTLNIGLAYLAAHLRTQQHDVKIIDAISERLSLQNFINLIREFAPHLIGFTAFTYQIPDTYTAIHALKIALPEIPVILGGCHAAALPEQTLQECPPLDFVAAGEGELTLLDTVQSLASGRVTPGEIPGLFVRDKDQVHPPHSVREPIENLDSLPIPAFDLFPLKRYRAFYTANPFIKDLPILTSRGCPYTCRFCRKEFPMPMRYRSIPLVIEEIAYLRSRFGIRQLLICDETFILRRERVVAFCEAFMSAGLHRVIRWYCQSRIEGVDLPLLMLMKQAGCKTITYGIESGDPHIRAIMHKKVDLEHAHQALLWTRQAGILAITNFIIGVPYETEASLQETLRRVKSLPAAYTCVSIFTPYPGTEMYQMALRGEGGAKILTKDWRLFGKQIGHAYELEQLSRKQLVTYQTRAYRSFYLTPRRWHRVFALVSPMGMLRYFLNLMHTRSAADHG